MKPTLNQFGKVCFYNGSEITGGTLRKAGYTVEEVLLMDNVADQKKVLEKVEQNRRLEKANEDTQSGGRSSGIYIGGNVNVCGDFVAGDATYINGKRVK